MDLDYLDIYNDLGEFEQQEEKKTKQVQELETKLETATKQIGTLEAVNKDLKEKLSLMKQNFQLLLDTVRAELRRKDKVILDLRREKDDLVFRRLNSSTGKLKHAPPRSQHRENDAVSQYHLVENISDSLQTYGEYGDVSWSQVESGSSIPTQSREGRDNQMPQWQNPRPRSGYNHRNPFISDPQEVRHQPVGRHDSYSRYQREHSRSEHRKEDTRNARASPERVTHERTSRDLHSTRERLKTFECRAGDGKRQRQEENGNERDNKKRRTDGENKANDHKENHRRLIGQAHIKTDPRSSEEMQEQYNTRSTKSKGNGWNYDTNSSKERKEVVYSTGRTTSGSSENSQLDGRNLTDHHHTDKVMAVEKQDTMKRKAVKIMGDDPQSISVKRSDIIELQVVTKEPKKLEARKKSLENAELLVVSNEDKSLKEVTVIGLDEKIIKLSKETEMLSEENAKPALEKEEIHERSTKKTPFTSVASDHHKDKFVAVEEEIHEHLDLQEVEANANNSRSASVNRSRLNETQVVAQEPEKSEAMVKPLENTDSRCDEAELLVGSNEDESLKERRVIDFDGEIMEALKETEMASEKNGKSVLKEEEINESSTKKTVATSVATDHHRDKVVAVEIEKNKPMDLKAVEANFNDPHSISINRSSLEEIQVVAKKLEKPKAISKSLENADSGDDEALKESRVSDCDGKIIKLFKKAGMPFEEVPNSTVEAQEIKESAQKQTPSMRVIADHHKDKVVKEEHKPIERNVVEEVSNNPQSSAEGKGNLSDLQLERKESEKLGVKSLENAEYVIVSGEDEMLKDRRLNDCYGKIIESPRATEMQSERSGKSAVEEEKVKNTSQKEEQSTSAVTPTEQLGNKTSQHEHRLPMELVQTEPSPCSVSDQNHSKASKVHKIDENSNIAQRYMNSPGKIALINELFGDSSFENLHDVGSEGGNCRRLSNHSSEDDKRTSPKIEILENIQLPNIYERKINAAALPKETTSKKAQNVEAGINNESQSQRECKAVTSSTVLPPDPVSSQKDTSSEQQDLSTPNKAPNCKSLPLPATSTPEKTQRHGEEPLRGFEANANPSDEHIINEFLTLQNDYVRVMSTLIDDEMRMMFETPKKATNVVEDMGKADAVILVNDPKGGANANPEKGESSHGTDEASEFKDDSEKMEADKAEETPHKDGIEMKKELDKPINNIESPVSEFEGKALVGKLMDEVKLDSHKSPKKESQAEEVLLKDNNLHPPALNTSAPLSTLQSEDMPSTVFPLPKTVSPDPGTIHNSLSDTSIAETLNSIAQSNQSTSKIRNSPKNEHQSRKLEVYSKIYHMEKSVDNKVNFIIKRPMRKKKKKDNNQTA